LVLSPLFGESQIEDPATGGPEGERNAKFKKQNPSGRWPVRVRLQFKIQNVARLKSSPIPAVSLQMDLSQEQKGGSLSPCGRGIKGEGASCNLDRSKFMLEIAA
jgi:hypothetical protein